MKNKILILSDLHFGESRESTTISGIIRQANTQAKETFQSIIPKLKEIKPNLLVHMGDALRDTYKKDIDSKNLSEAISLVESVGVPTIHLLGNHELNAFEYGEIENIYDTAIQKHEFFGFMDLDEFQIVWLDLEIDENNLAYISEKRLQWLMNLSLNKKPTILFSHYSLASIDSSGSFYFENNPQGMYYKNFNEVKDILTSLNIKLFINAHVHLLTHQKIDTQHFISNPAFSENITAEKYPENNPGIYSVLEIDDNNFVFTSYSGSFCFAKIQGELG
ncbi:metallophosphoesterase [Candidatus Woesebacteria bacterium]|nr:metallophosphoesterase [Candidatus Woesebacteria bacterium]